MKKLMKSMLGAMVAVLLIFTQLSFAFANEIGVNATNSDKLQPTVDADYFTNLTVAEFSKLFLDKNGKETSAISIVISNKDFTISKEIMQYIKNEKKDLSIVYPETKYIAPVVDIFGQKLQDTSTDLEVQFFENIKIGEKNNEISQVFGKYGIVEDSFTIPMSNKVSGVSYFAEFPYQTDGKYYHLYKYLEDNHSFSACGIYCNELDPGTYFLVNEANDNLVNYQNGDIDKGILSYYKQVDDTVIRGDMENGKTTWEISSKITELNLSASTVAYLKQNNKNISFISYNPDFNTETTQTTIDVQQLQDGTLKYTFPVVMISNNNTQIEELFTGGTPDKYYNVTTNKDKVPGISTNLISSSEKNNWYEYYNNSYSPITLSKTGFRYIGPEIDSVNDEYGNHIYFSIPKDQDTYVKPTDQTETNIDSETVQTNNQVADSAVTIEQKEANPQQAQQTVQTSDTAPIWIYVLGAVIGVAAIGAVVIVDKRRAKIK